MKKLYFVTGNAEKVREAQAILSVPIEIVSLDLDEIQSLSPKEIVEHKVRQAYEKVKKTVFVDDVSVEVEAWNGFPGPLVKFLEKAGKGRYELALKMLESETNKNVRVVDTIGYFDGKILKTFEGSFTGKITARRGENGWGFDPYVIPDGQDKTFGELEFAEKNKISHRQRALLAFKEFLDSQA